MLERRQKIKKLWDLSSVNVFIIVFKKSNAFDKLLKSESNLCGTFF